MADGAIEVKLSLKGRPIREFVFSQSRVTIGRDPQSHIVLDNPGISRCHAELLREEDGFYIQDQGSANGTFLNDVPVTRALVRDGDRLRIGKFLLMLRVASEQRATASGSPAFPESTMVLEPAQIDRLMRQAKQAELEAGQHPPTAEPVSIGNVLRAPEPVSPPPTPALADGSPRTSPSRGTAQEPSSASEPSTVVFRPAATPPASLAAGLARPAPPLVLHEAPASESGHDTSGTPGGVAGWVRAHIIALEIGFTAGLAVGIAIGMTVLR